MGLLTRTGPLAGLVLAACVPDLAVDLARVDEPRILAVRAEPAEVAPGEEVTLTALYADASGTLAKAPLAWSLCTARRPLAELGPVNRECVAGGDALLSLGAGLSVAAALPGDVCRLFGPEPPPASAGEPSGRPVDPDPSGGYYQPIRLATAEDDVTLFQLRIACGLAGATQQQAAEFRRRYRANAAPAIAGFGRADGRTLTSEEPLVAAPGEAVGLRVSWETCPEGPVCGDGLCTLDEDAEACAGDCAGAPGCGGAETYLRFDPGALALTERREAIRVAWFATAGGFDATGTGRAADDREDSSDNVWTAPEEPGAATIWVVLRDDRGGVAWRAVPVTVE
jgi:hypothetical protein